MKHLHHATRLDRLEWWFESHRVIRALTQGFILGGLAVAIVGAICCFASLVCEGHLPHFKA